MDFNSVTAEGLPKIIICHNLPDVLPVLRSVRLDLGNVEGFVDLAWCLPYSQIVSQPGKPHWREVVAPWLERGCLRSPTDAADLAELSVRALRAIPHLTFPLDFQVCP